MHDGFPVRRALLTGATGFVGSHLTRRLVRDGWEVCVVTRPDSNLRQLQSVMPKVKIAECHNDVGGLRSVISENSPAVVFHLASRFIAEHRPDQIPDLIDSNIRFGTELMEALVAERVLRLVNVGTSWQHFGTDEYRPVCLYAATKQAFEAIIDFYVDSSPLRVVTLKLCDTYGPDDPRQKLFAALRSARNTHLPVPFSAGEQLIDLVYIDDAVEAFVMAAERLLHQDAPAHQKFAVSSGTPVSLRHIAETYASVTGECLNIAWGARPYRTREVMVPWFGGLPVPGWYPKVTLPEGIRRIE